MKSSALREREACEYIGLSQPTFRKLAKTDPDFPVPSILGARTRLFLVRDLDAYMEGKKKKA